MQADNQDLNEIAVNLNMSKRALVYKLKNTDTYHDQRILQSVTALLILTPLWGTAQPASPLSGEMSALLDTCRKEPSPLIRLDCYDNIGRDKAVPQTEQAAKGDIWRRAAANEEKRTEHTVTFITTQPREGTWPVVMTAPAIGTQPPRPILMLSCVDNITRMQLVMNTP